MSLTLADLRAKLAEEIPITTHLGVRIVGHDVTGLTLGAPLAKNRNHEGTGFAGSVNTLATLAGWSLVWLALRQAGEDCQVVLQDSAVEYRRPVTGDFEARAGDPGPAEWRRLLDALARHGWGRIGVVVEVRVADMPVAMYRGRYVAVKKGREGREGR